MEIFFSSLCLTGSVAYPALSDAHFGLSTQRKINAARHPPHLEPNFKKYWSYTNMPLHHIHDMVLS